MIFCRNLSGYYHNATHNLALAVLIGVIISIVFAWESAKRIRAKKIYR
jgi:membrane protein CcdC involved in cytochrome C biogenesis